MAHHRMVNQTSENVIGSERVIKAFGCWPIFNDAEVLSFALERGADASSRTSIGRLRVRVRVRDCGDAAALVDDSHRPRFLVITFEFRGIDALEVDGWNYQNVIDEINVAQAEAATSRLAVEVLSAWGFEASFYCEEAEVVGLEGILGE